MTQFAVYKNKNPQTKSIFPLLLDVQTGLLSDLHSRVVVPLTKSPAALQKPVSRLTPIIKVEGVPHLLVTYQLAAISQSALGSAVADASENRDAIIAALDLLLTGI
jgi:toxin CcdB